MSFDLTDTSVQDVTVAIRDTDLAVSWSSTLAAGQWFQVYLDRRLAWHGTDRSCLVPNPGRLVRIEVGAVDAAEAAIDLSSTLPTPAGGGSRIQLTWEGGTFLGASIAAFRIYLGTVPGGAVNYAAPIATVPSHTPGLPADGWGMGGYGSGVYGTAGGSYEWTSEPVLAGTWNVAVVPVDSAGNEGTPETASVAVSGPPRPPARNASGQRVTATVSYTTGGYGANGYDVGGYGAAASPIVTLSWLASPGS